MEIIRVIFTTRKVKVIRRITFLGHLRIIILWIHQLMKVKEENGREDMNYQGRMRSKKEGILAKISLRI